MRGRHYSEVNTARSAIFVHNKLAKPIAALTDHILDSLIQIRPEKQILDYAHKNENPDF